MNPDDVRSHRGIIANPNCTTAVALMALYPLHRAFGLRRVFAASYQAVSGSGRARDRGAEDDRSKPASRGGRCAGGSLSRIRSPSMCSRTSTLSSRTATREEEMKLQNEGRKMMHLPNFRASVTCVRVPVYRAHSVALSAEFERPVSVEKARAVLANAPGLDLVDDPASNRYPTPLDAAGKDNCQVGRLRIDCAFENGLALWVAGDQLLKGAALNAVQIAELL